MNTYLKMLMKQFIEARGIKNIVTNSDNFKEEFVKWLAVRFNQGCQYLDFVKSIVEVNNDKTTIEVGKGCFDSIANYCLDNATIITPYTTGLKVNEERQIIKSPLIISREGLTNIPSAMGCTLMTHNPYSGYCLKNWKNLHNSRLNNVIVCIYGDKKDKDIDEKTDMLLHFKQKLDGNFIELRETKDESYFHVVASKPVLDNLKVKFLDADDVPKKTTEKELELESGFKLYEDVVCDEIDRDMLKIFLK